MSVRDAESQPVGKEGDDRGTGGSQEPSAGGAPLAEATAQPESEANLAPTGASLPTAEPEPVAPMEPIDAVSESAEGASPTTAAPAVAPESGPTRSGTKPPEESGSDSTPHQDWSVIARSVLIALLLGVAVVAWAQFTFSSRWVTQFLIDNQLGKAERQTLLVSLVLGALAGVALASGWVVFARRKQQPLAEIERWMWFLSPLILLPTLPILFRYKAWQDRHEELLPALFFVCLCLEVLAHKCLQNIPAAANKTWIETRSVWRSPKLQAFLEKHGYLLLVLAGALAYSVFMSFYTIRWHHKLGTGTYDLGINNNLLYGGFFGDFNQSRIVFPHEPQKYLANHVKIGLYFFLPIYAICPRPETLQAIQATLLGFGAVPLFLFARRHVAELAAALIAFAWLCYYPMHGANFYEVKMVPMASFFVLMTVWAADAKRFRLMWACFIIGLLMREDMPVGFAMIGGFLLLSGHRPLQGLIMVGVSSAWFLFLRFYVMEEIGEWWFPKMYKDLWADGEQGFKSVVKTLVSNPFFTFKHVFIESKLVYLMHLFVPLAFLPARRWYLWAAFLPGAILTLLVTDYKPVTMFSFQYVMHWAPYMFLAIPLAIASYQKKDVTRGPAALTALVLASAVLTYNYGAFSLRDKGLKAGYHKITYTFTPEERERYQNLLDIIAFIEPEASVVSTEKIGPHVSSRRVHYSLRRDSYHADYLIARQRGLRLDRTRKNVAAALVGGEYGVYKRIGEFVLAKRGYSTKGNQAVIEEWSLARDRDPDELDEEEAGAEAGDAP